jgi:electron-transferring-flavoprotein dehydrogenase
MKENRPPIHTEVTSDNFYFLYGDHKSLKIPNILFPKTIHNEGNYVISLGKLTRWMG